MRVLHLVKTPVGASWAVRQIRELVKLGVDVHVAVPPGGPRAQDYTAVGAAVHLLQTDFPVRRPWRWRRLRAAFRDLINRVRPDIIHSHFVGTTLTMRLALGRRHPVPRVFMVPGPLHLEYPFFRRVETALAGPRDYWIASCRWTLDCYRRVVGIEERRTFLAYYGVDLDAYRAREPGKLRAELGIAPQTKLVGMVAYLYAPRRYLGQRRGIKGHEDLIEALRICLDRGADVCGVFIGGAWNDAVAYEQRVRAYGQAQCGDRARFLGTRADVPDLYPDLDVAVHPSHSENIGGAVESLLMGVPTIATNVGGLPDLVLDGRTGYLVPPRNPRALADRILTMLENPEEGCRMALAGRELAAELLDVRRNAAAVFDAYRQVLEDNP